MKTVFTEASECQDFEDGSGPGDYRHEAHWQQPALVPAVACAALGSCRTQKESEDSPRWPSTHMQQSMQEAAAESVRRLWDRSRGS